LVQLASALTGSDYLLFVNASSQKLWLSTGGYDPTDARASFLGLSCFSGSGSTCVPTRSVYVTWGQPVKVYSASGQTEITADALAISGTNLVFGATVSGQTTVLSSPNGGGTVTALGTVAGTLTSLSETPESAFATTMSSGSLVASTFSLNGGVVADPTIASGVQNASGTWVATPSGYEEAVVASLPGSDAVSIYTSTNGGDSFSAATRVATLNESSPSAIFNSIGETRLVPPGGLVGQVATASVGGELFVLYTNRVDGRVLVETEVSPNGGTVWEGPYLAAPVRGSVQDPTLSVEPDGDLLGSWLDNANDSWEVDQAVFSPQGTPISSVSPLPASGGNANPSFAAASPAAAVDSFGRPLYAWVAPSSGGGTQIDYSGAFISAANSLEILERLVSDPIEKADVAVGTLPSFVSTADSDLNQTLSDINPTNRTVGLSNAQNSTVKTIVPEVTALALHVTTTGFPAVSATTTPLQRDLGVFSPNVYLGVTSAQLINALGGSLAASPFTGVPSYGLAQGPMPPSAVRVSSTQDGDTGTVTVTPTPQSPTAVELITAGSFPELTSTVKTTCVYGGVKYTETVYRWTELTSYWSNVTLVGGPTAHFSSSSALPSVYLTNLTPQSNVSWSGVFAADYVEYMTVTCDTQQTTTQVTPVTLGVNPFDVTVSGSVTTSLAVVPGQPYLLNGVWKGSTVPASLTADWNDSMLARGGIWLNYSSNGTLAGSSTNSSYLIAHSASFSGLKAGEYTAQLIARSEAGGYSSSEKPAVSGGDTSSYPAEFASDSCTFSLSAPSYHLWWSAASNVSGITGSSVQLQWSANVSGIGSATYYEAGTGVNYTIVDVSAVQNESVNDSTWTYSIGLHNLDPLAIYAVTLGVAVGGGCLQKTLTRGFDFQTLGVLSLGEFDEPYDSITDEGGGASVWWELPLASAAQFVSGVLFWQNATATAQLPLTTAYAFESTPRSVGMVNLSLPQGNTSYKVWAMLNYSFGNQAINLTSAPTTFVYQRGTSGDGLTDLEKVNGWTVPVTNVSGTVGDQWVQANPQDYATNGLASDFVEKEFDLNPNTVDTAGSHMLDTWNLTFNLGPGSGKLPSGSNFRVWYENTTYSPFAKSVAYTPGSNETGTPVLANLSSIAAGPLPTSGDGSSAAATYLWSYTALEAFVNLTGVRSAGWLRAVEGSWQGLPTLTVWGKLSWGANPLAQSTSGDGLLDGTQADPLEPEIVQLNVTSWSATLASGSDEAAPYVEVSSGSSGSGTVYYQGYGPAAGDTGQQAVTYTGPYLVSVPVASQSQFVYFNVTLNDAEKSGVATLATVASTQVDLLGPSGTHALRSTGSGSLSGSYQVVRVPEVANTLLWAPANNTTLSPVPWGLKRYVAEPDFDLLMLNVSAKTRVNGIEGAEGGWQYSVTLQPGLNNILVPRGAFIASPLGQALINNTNDSTIKIPKGAGVTFTPADWSGRTETSGSNSPGNPSYIWVFSSTTQSQANTTNQSAFGGLPQNEAVEAGLESRQVQAVYWVNLTTAGNGLFSSAAAELDDLVGGLVLNGSGNFTGNLLNVTSEVPTLGLPSNVREALANATVPNGGKYAAPQYQQPPPPPPFWQQWGSAIWDTLTGIAEVTGISKLISVVWNFGLAAGAYIGEAFVSLSNHLGLGKLVNQLVSGLKAIASAMAWALNEFLTYILKIVKSAFTVAFAFVWNSVKTALTSLAGFEAGAEKSVLSYVSGTGSLTSAASAETLGLAPFIALAFAVLVAVDVALGITLPLSISIGVVLGLALSVIVSAVGSGSLSTLGAPFAGPVESTFSSGFAGTASTFASASEAVMNYTFSDVLGSGLTSTTVQPLPDPPNFVGTTGLVVAATSLGIGAVKASRTPSDVAAQAGFLLSVISFGLSLDTWAYDSIQSNGCNNQPNAIVDALLGEDMAAFFLGLGGLALDLKGVFSSAPTNKLIALGGLGFDGAGLFTGLKGIQTDLTCESTATG